MVILGFSLSLAASVGQETASDESMTSGEIQETPKHVEGSVLEKKDRWHIQVAADYTKLYGDFWLRSNFLPYDVDGDRDGDAYGAVFSVSLPSWTPSRWLEFWYRAGEVTGQNHYTDFFTGASLGTTDIVSDLTEFGVSFRSTYGRRMAGGVSFQYQDWKTDETGVGRLSYRDTLYLLNFDFGPHWQWRVGERVDLGIRLLFGAGLGYGQAGRPDVDSGFAGDLFGTASGTFQWLAFGPSARTRIFAEAGVRGMFYYIASGDYYASESQAWGYYGPFGKFGLRIRF